MSFTYSMDLNETGVMTYWLLVRASELGALSLSAYLSRHAELGTSGLATKHSFTQVTVLVSSSVKKTRPEHPFSLSISTLKWCAPLLSGAM